jgi:hypothetical protein
MEKIGMMRLLLLVMLAGMGLQAANGQTPTKIDTNNAEIQKEHPNRAILIVDAMMRDEKGNVMGCTYTILSLVGMHGKVVRIRTHNGSLFGKSDEDGGINQIEPGFYLVAGITCEIAGQHLYRGNFAKITIRPGEIVAAGTLVIDYKKEGLIFSRKYSGHPHVEDFRPKTLASLNERAPLTMARAKKSLMVELTDQEKRGGPTTPKGFTFKPAPPPESLRAE